MTLIEAGMAPVEASNLLDRGVETLEQLHAYLAATPDWQDKLGRVVSIAVENLLAEHPAP